MNKNYLALSIIATLAILGILVTELYSVLVVKPKETVKQEYLSIMQACNQQRLYMTWELKSSLNNVSNFASQEEKEIIDQVMDNSTEYLHSPEFYLKCLEKTRNEWSLSD